MEMIILRLVHVLGAIFWVGSGVFTAFFLQPILVKAGPAGAPVIQGLQQRKLFVLLPIVAILTILSGARLMQISSGGFSAAYFAAGPGKAFAFGAVCGILAFLIGLTLVRPAGERMAALSAQLAGARDNEERARLGAELAPIAKRMGLMSKIVTVLIILAAASMAIARYL